MAKSKYGKYFFKNPIVQLNFKVMHKPVIFMNVALTPQYIQNLQKH